MADAHQKHHDYHIIDPSPWPLIGSIGALVMALGGIGWMQASEWQRVRLLGFRSPTRAVLHRPCLVVLYTMFGWWGDTIKEAHQGHHTRCRRLHLRYGMIMFIASEVMFFVAWFWAFFDASLFPDEAAAGCPRRLYRWNLAAGRHRGARSAAPAALQHA
jgi:cytochrome c oxidase subunit 3